MGWTCGLREFEGEGVQSNFSLPSFSPSWQALNSSIVGNREEMGGTGKGQNFPYSTKLFESSHYICCFQPQMPFIWWASMCWLSWVAPSRALWSLPFCEAQISSVGNLDCLFTPPLSSHWCCSLSWSIPASCASSSQLPEKSQLGACQMMRPLIAWFLAFPKLCQLTPTLFFYSRVRPTT